MQSIQEDLRTAKADDQPNVKMTLEELINDIDKELCAIPPLQPYELTRARFVAEHEGMTEGAAKWLLDKLVNERKLVKEYRRYRGSTVAVYRKAV